MATNTCEETSICKKFQSAICLHCNRRLCVEHLVQHYKISSTITNLSNDIKLTYQKIKEQSDKRRQTFNKNLNSLNHWKIEQIDKIQHTYDLHMKSIQSQCDTLNNTETKFYEQLDKHARQPLENLKQQNIVDMKAMLPIQRMVRKIREDNIYLNSKLTTISPPAVDVQLPSVQDSRSISTKEKSPSNNDNRPEEGRPLKRLVKMFSNLSAIKKSKAAITVYLRKPSPLFQLPIIICSYLTAWYNKTNINDKSSVLNEHILTIEKYLNKCQSGFDVLIGIQLFFHHHQTMSQNKNEMMTFLLQFFLTHKSINQNQIFNWYNSKDTSGYKGFTYAKHLATPFIQSLSTNQIVNNHPTSIPTSIKTEVKQEPN